MALDRVDVLKYEVMYQGSEAGELGHGLHLQLGHEIGAVHFDRALAGVEACGGLLVQVTAQDVGQYFAFPGCEGLKSGLQLAAAGVSE